MEIVETQSVQSHEDKVWALAWHHSGKFLATGSSDKLIKIWGKPNGDASEGLTHKSTLDGAHTRTVRSLAWKPGCQVGSLVLASSSFDATACIWMQESSEESQGDFEPYQTLEGHENEIKCIAWSNNGAYVATCSRDKSIWIFDEEGEDVLEYSCMGVLSGHSQDVKFVKWHPERDQLFSSSYDDTLMAWGFDNSVDEWVCLYTMRGHSSTVWSFDFDPTGNFLASCSEDKTWIIWSVTNNSYRKLCQIKDTHFRAIYSISWTQIEEGGDHRIATVGSDNQLIVHTVDQAQLQQAAASPPVDEASQEAPIVQPQLSAKVAMAHESDINAVQFCPTESNKLATVSDDGKLKLWEIRVAQTDQADVEMDNN